MLSLAAAAACLTVSLLVRIWASMLRRMLPFSTLIQFLAVGTNQLRAAARSLIFDALKRVVVLGMLPMPSSAFWASVLVYSLIQSLPSDLSAPTGTARSEPPRKPGMTWPFTWLGMTNWPVTPVYCLPTQQLNQAGPTIDAARPCAYTSYGFGCASSVVLLALDAALKKFLYAVSPAIDFFESSVPFHLPLTV